MCKTFCLANSWEKIEYYIEKIRTKKVLSQKNREIIFSKIIKNFGSASKNIHDFLLKDYSKNLTVTPERTLLPKSLASQFVKRIQPCDAVLEIKDGFGVP